MSTTKFLLFSVITLSESTLIILLFLFLLLLSHARLYTTKFKNPRRRHFLFFKVHKLCKPMWRLFMSSVGRTGRLYCARLPINHHYVMVTCVRGLVEWSQNLHCNNWFVSLVKVSYFISIKCRMQHLWSNLKIVSDLSSIAKRILNTWRVCGNEEAIYSSSICKWCDMINSAADPKSVH